MSPPQSASPALAKVSCQGADKLEQNVFLMLFIIFIKKVMKSPFVKYCLMSKGFFFLITKTTVAVFTRGSQKRKSTNDDKHDNGQEKRISTFK